MKYFSLFPLLILASGIFASSFLVAPAFAQDAEKVQDLLRIIQAQQKQLEAQQKQLDAQSRLLQEIQAQTKSLVESSGKEVGRLEDRVEQQQSELTSLQQQVTQQQIQPTQAATLAEAAKTEDQAPDKKVVTSGGADRAKLVVSGFVNRMVMGVDDGVDTEYYNVDNDNAESRVSFLGTLDATDDLTLGTRIELTIAPNKSGNISQINQEENNIFDQRWVEMHLDSKRYGRLSLGKGDTASFNTGASDLSGTTVIAYATIADTAGGMLFREEDGGAFTDVNIFQAFNNWDGLNRRSRVRYDTPRLHGFSLATSIISDSRYDGAVRWGGQGYGFKAVGSAAIADPNVSGEGLNYTGSFSVLHEDSGINLSFSAGTRERDVGGDPYSLYGKLGWRKNFFAIGETAFGIDYAYTEHAPTDDDEGYSYGFAAVQQFEDYGTEAYALYRLHSLDRSVAPEVDDIDVLAVGARMKF